MKAIKERIVDTSIVFLCTCVLILAISFNDSYAANLFTDSEEELPVDEVVTDEIGEELEEIDMSEFNVTAGSIEVLSDAMAEVNGKKSSSDISGIGPVAGINADIIKIMRNVNDDMASVTDSEITEVAESNPGENVYEQETGVEEMVITAIDQVKMYVNISYGTLNVREQPDLDAEILATLSVNDEVTIVGEVADSEFVQIHYGEITGFVSENYLSDKKIELPKVPTYNWNGEVLNATNGKIQGPSGTETYYNLDMSKIVQMMSKYGYSNYYVGSNGVKYLDGYIMCAADLSIRPRGTIVQTSLGAGLVCDTGSFVAYDSTRLDIATSW